MYQVLVFLCLAFSIPTFAKQSPIEIADAKIKHGGYVRIDSMLIFHRNQQLFEAYYRGFNRTFQHRTHSTFKSINALIALIAIEQKLLSESESVFELFRFLEPKIRFEQPKREITIKDLLNMTSGLDCDESPGNNGTNHEYGVDEGPAPFQYALNIKQANKPGEFFSYCNANSFLIAASVSAALKRAGRENIFEFAHSYLFARLGIRKNQYRLRTSPQGNLLMGQGNSNFTSQDLAKFGLLVLNKGRYKDKRVLKSDSVEKIYKAAFPTNWSWTTEIPEISDWPNYYSHQWYHTEFSYQGQKIKSIHSWGNGGQFIFVIPQLELVMVFTGSNQGGKNFKLQKQPFEIIQNYIIPHIIGTNST